MTGNGTQASPYIVTDWNELAQVFPTAQYIELGNDIQAPDLSTSIAADYLASFDGKGHSIIGMYSTSGYVFTVNIPRSNHEITIKDVNFNNINCQGTGILSINGSGFGEIYARFKNVTFNGNLYCDRLMHFYNDVKAIMQSVGGNIHTNNAEFSLGKFVGSSELHYGRFCIDYGDIEPDSDYSLYRSRLTAYNTEFEISAPSNGNIYFGGCAYCAFKGKGNVWIDSSSGINVVEDTLSIHSSSTGTNHLLSTADIKNVQVLYDLGFPVSGVI
jgi:hypothetical protein